MPDRERRAAPCTHHQAVMPREHDRQRVRPVQPAQGRARRLLRSHAALEVQVDQLGHRLGVRLGLEHLAFAFELRAQVGVVLDDAVMDHRHPCRPVRVRVAERGGTVRRPARVADAGVAIQRLRARTSARFTSLPGARRRSIRSPSSVAMPGAVVAAIFEPPQRVQNDASRRPVPDHADDAAHVRFPSVVPAAPRMRPRPQACRFDARGRTPCRRRPRLR